MTRSCQLGGNLAFISTKSGPYGISNLISNSGGRSPLATTAVGMTSICGIRIFPDLRTLFLFCLNIGSRLSWLSKTKEHIVHIITRTRCVSSCIYSLDDFPLVNTTPLRLVCSNPHDLHMCRIFGRQFIRLWRTGFATPDEPSVIIGRCQIFIISIDDIV